MVRLSAIRLPEEGPEYCVVYAKAVAPMEPGGMPSVIRIPPVLPAM
jgi:hypothetical protein